MNHRCLGSGCGCGCFIEKMFTWPQIGQDSEIGSFVERKWRRGFRLFDGVREMVVPRPP